jgi:SNF2-related domain/Helicase conserved C-terminal domain
MSYKFATRCLPSYVEISLTSRALVRSVTVEPASWAGTPKPLSVIVNKLLLLVEDGKAKWSGSALHLENDVAAEIQGAFAAAIGLPDLAPIMLDISFHGTIGDPDGQIKTEWKDSNYRPIMPPRSGIAIVLGGKTYRLAAPIFDLVTAIDAFNHVGVVDSEKRIERRAYCWEKIQDGLSRVRGSEEVSADEYTRSLTILQAGSFSLDISEGRKGIQFQPLLMSRSKARSLDDNAPSDDLRDVGETLEGERRDTNPFDDLVDSDTALLVGEDHRAFLRQFEAATPATSRAYAIRRNTYLLIDPELRRALDVVKRMQSAEEPEKRAFAKNPRTVIAAELGIDGGDDLLTALFVETKQYSDRVIGLGLWERPELPWLKKLGTDWLPEKFPARVNVAGQSIEVSQPDAEGLKQAVEVVEKASGAEVVFQGRPILLETARDILKQIDDDVGIQSPPLTPDDGASDAPRSDGEAANRKDRFVVKIKTNYDGKEYEIARSPRFALIKRVPPPSLMGSTTFKSHQTEGFSWLVDAWVDGWPGVLLADDMGLGKTFQALAFLAWIRERQRVVTANGSRGRSAPTLIVAPTALLDNWIEESQKHLARHALGNVAKVFGTDLKRFKNVDKEASIDDPLDVGMLNEFDWILTTYETLADNHTSFAKMKYGVGVFDEIQKVKDPGTLNTLASKSLNIQFVIGLTGTPVENRIEDLWSIMDRVVPGYLGDLKAFSNAYEDASEDKYRQLNDLLAKSIGGAAPIMLRRMKEDVLDGLPRKEVVKYRTMMPSPQAEIYDRVVSDAVARQKAGKGGRGAMLEIIQKLRSVSLYPDDPWKYDLSKKAGCYSWIERSARLVKTLEILKGIDKKGEKALVFVENLYMQERLAEALTTLFELDNVPFVINGAMPGSRRQKRVNEFQVRKGGFDVMILSPKAAGIGLTITAANHVIHLSRWWNPAVEDQCNDRVYRIGQSKPVTIHVPVAVHPIWDNRTFDVTLDNLLSRKRTISRSLLAPPVSEKDLGEIFGATMKAAA